VLPFRDKKLSVSFVRFRAPLRQDASVELRLNHTTFGWAELAPSFQRAFPIPLIHQLAVKGWTPLRAVMEPTSQSARGAPSFIIPKKGAGRSGS
jgi:hypothetical protein